MNVFRRNPMSSDHLGEEEKRQIALIAKLGQLEEFQVWRDLVVKARVAQLEDLLRSSDQMSEGVLRGSIKHYLSVKDLFTDVFEKAAEQSAANQEENLNSEL